MSVWDHYLDATDASLLLEAAAVVERHHAVREPLPLHDPPRLLDRLRTIATFCDQDARHWQHEADDRREEAAADGGRWGSPEAAAEMAAHAEATVAAWDEIARVTSAAADDLAVRLAERTAPDAREAADRADRGVRRLLGEIGLGPDARD